MARLPSERFLVQQIGPDVVLFEEDKCFAHFWAGYFWAHHGGAD